MGWTSYHADYYKNGKVDVKKEMDMMWTQEEREYNLPPEPKHYPKLEVLKSSMVGSTYYAAVKSTNTKEKTEEVFAVICLTSVNNKDYFNFSYKCMDETAGPYQDKCPKSILNLLTPTHDEYAFAWRMRCWEYHLKKKEKKTIATLPINSCIKFIDNNDRVVELIKMHPNHQFKRPWWKVFKINGKEINHGYWSSRHIPDIFTITKEESYETVH